MTYTTLKTTVAALALTAGTAFAADEVTGNLSGDVDANTAGVSANAEVDSSVSTDATETAEGTLKKLQTESAEALDAATDTANEAADTAANTAGEIADDATSLAQDATDEATSGAAEVTAEAGADVAVDSDVAAAEISEGFSGMVASDLVGLDVIAADGKGLGEIESIIREDNKLAAIVGVGGFLGLGEREVSVPLSELSRSDEGSLRLSTWTKAEIEARPEVEPTEVEVLQPEDTLDTDS